MSARGEDRKTGRSKISSSSSSSGGGGRRSAVPPVSLAAYAASKGYCSVTDLVSPSWCEYAFQYNTLGMSHLPISERPEQIVTPQGNIVKVNADLAQQRERVLVAGREVHKRLEREVHPVRIYVETTTTEDAWGLRILQLVSGLKVLMDGGCCRELPVFGFIEGTLVFGVIDEIRIHHDRPAISTTSSNQKYASQEEWKRKAPQRKKRKLLDDSNQQSLSSFLPGRASSLPEEEKHREDPRQTFGLVLEDAKTRYSMSMPEEKDQTQSKLQCMLYKRLFDGIVIGFAKDTSGAQLDKYATPIGKDMLLDRLDLDGQVPLSEGFMRDAEELCDSFDVSLRSFQLEEGGWSCNLCHLFGILSETVEDLVQMTRKGASDKTCFEAIRSELRLTYRKREGHWMAHKKKKSRGSDLDKDEKERRQKPQRAKDSNADIRKMLQNGANIEDLDEEAQVELALQISLGGVDKDEEEEKLADHSIPLPSPRKSKKKDIIIGQVRFQHDAHALEAHLIDIMAMWKGNRTLRGVTLEQTWRCNHCEYLDDCEWRHLKAEETLQQAMTKKKETEDEAIWSQFDDDVLDDLDW